MAAVSVDLDIVQSETFEQEFVIYEDSTKTMPLDLTGAEILAIAMDVPGTDVLPSSPYDLAPAVTEAAAGRCSISLTTAETEAFAIPSTGSNCPRWDLFLVKDGVATKLFKGCIIIETSITDPTP